jgi:glyoxylase-like metal-dependent hydrolase (beta-lactamase superfamily II)
VALEHRPLEQRPSEQRPSEHGTPERWSIGDISVTKVLETMLDHERAVDVLPISDEDLGRHRGWMGPYLGANGEMLMSVHTFCVQTGEQKIVVDTCIGNDQNYGESPYLAIFNGLATDLLERMETIGFGPSEVDLVVCTHLHPDHVGWNTIRAGDTWVPTFPRARYVLSRKDADAWRTLKGAHNPWPFAVQPIEDAGQLDLVDAPAQLAEGVSLRPTPGHTPGHVSVVLQSQGETAVITGDMVHSPVQLVEPAWTYKHDSDRAEATRSVESLVGLATAHQALILGTHFPTPTAGNVRRGPGGLSWIPQ